MSCLPRRSSRGFTLIELIIVITIIGILVAIFLPRYWEVERQARIATLDGVVGAMRSAAGITKAKALSQGLSPATSDPGGGAAQDIYIVDVEGLNVEVDWYTLCPESRAERGANAGASMLDFIYLDAVNQTPTSPIDGTLYAEFNNQFTWVGFNITAAGANAGTGPGCYVEYNSFGTRGSDPACPVTLVIDDC